MAFEALHKQGPDYSISEGFLIHMLLLVFLEVCTKMKSFHTYSTPEHFLAVLCFFMLSQVKNTSQDQSTLLTRVALLGK